jgi:hypothetical protein
MGGVSDASGSFSEAWGNSLACSQGRRTVDGSWERRSWGKQNMGAVVALARGEDAVVLGGQEARGGCWQSTERQNKWVSHGVGRTQRCASCPDAACPSGAGRDAW